MPSERKEKSTTPLARDDFSNNEFNTIINTGLHQAKNNESRPVKDVFSDLRKRIWFPYRTVSISIFIINK